MIIKILSATGEFVAEAEQYRLHRKTFDSEERMWEYMRDFGDHYIPFSLETKSGAREVLILQITEPNNSVIVVTDCHVFVMNNQGKTIDRFSVAGELIEAN